MSSQITSNSQETTRLASLLATGAHGYGKTTFSRCADVSDAVAASQHDDVGGAYVSAAKEYRSAVKRDTKAIIQMGDAFQAADAIMTEIMLSLG